MNTPLPSERPWKKGGRPACLGFWKYCNGRSAEVPLLLIYYKLAAYVRETGLLDLGSHSGLGPDLIGSRHKVCQSDRVCLGRSKSRILVAEAFISRRPDSFDLQIWVSRRIHSVWISKPLWRIPQPACRAIGALPRVVRLEHGLATGGQSL